MKNKYNNDTNRKILNHYIIDNNTNHSNKMNKDKSIYSFISLKSRQKNLSDINSNLSNSSKDISFDNVLGKNVFQAKFSNKFHYNQKRYNHAPINLIKDSNLFNNLTIKDKIGAFYKWNILSYSNSIDNYIFFIVLSAIILYDLYDINKKIIIISVLK